MKVSWNWLSQLVDLHDLTPEEVAEKLTFAGAEVEEISRPASGTNLVIGKILSCAPHPDSDHLHVLNVDEGKVHGVHQIVCGAPNAREGINVIVAREGAVLPEVTIEKSTIRGVESDGMCCSLLELGVEAKYLNDAQKSGIEELPEDAPIGEEDVLGYLGLSDVVIDISVLPNRPDLYAVKNIASEVACLLNRPLIESKTEPVKTVASDFHVGSETPKCPLFTIREYRGVTSAPSPKWLSSILRSQGIRSIDAIVDIGNYVMLLTGQPLNMYDLDKLPERSLVVRDDLEGSFKAMDGNEYPLQKGDLVVTSGGLPMCLAGTMTADACRIDENTKNIAVEAAVFDGASIRHTSNRIGLSSDSSLRFCKGINPDQMEYVQEVTSALLRSLCGAKEVGQTVSYDTLSHSKRVIETSLSYINGRLGTSFTMDEVTETLKRDHLSPSVQGDAIQVTLPDYRIDMDGEADVSEEVIRIRGYENVPSTLPTSKLTLNGLSAKQLAERSIKRYLLATGISESITYTLLSRGEIAKFAYLEKAEPYILKNPMTVEREAVRTNLLHSILLVASYNAARQEKDCAFFEISDVDGIGLSGRHLAIVLSGEKKERGSLSKRAYDFYDAKGILEGVLDILRVIPTRYQLVPWSLGGKEFHPGRSAEVRMGKKLIGVLGELHPSACKEYGLKSAAVIEFDLAALLDLKVSPVKASIPPKFPSISRDLAFVIPSSVSYGDVKRELSRVDSLLKSVDVFDVYQGQGIAEGKKSLAVSLTFRSEDRTLKDAEVASVMDKVILTLKTKFGAEVRG